jgi:outer membrane usher protein
MRALPALLTSAMLLGWPLTADAAIGQEPATARSNPAMRVNLPLVLSGTYLGDLPAEVAAPDVLVAADDLIRLLGPRLKKDAIEHTVKMKRADGMVALAALSSVGINASYNPETLEIAAVMKLEEQGSRSLRVLAANDFSGDAFDNPARFSASSIVNLSQTFFHNDGIFADVEPIRAAMQTAFNVGGDRGINIFAETFYDGERGAGFHRGPVTLTHENRSKALRFLAGDLSPSTTSFQAGQALGGIGIEKSYSELQPYRNVRPAGLFKFAIEQDSVVEVLVNGAPSRAFRLERGQYDVRDFNFTSGLNRVEIYTVDSYGRRLVASFSQFFNFNLLDPGIDEYAAYVGVPQVRSAAGGIGYAGRAVATAFYRRGITQSLTAGADIQASSIQQMAGVSAGYATALGTFALASAVSRDADAGVGHQLLLNYQIGGERALFFGAPSFDLELRSRSRRFVAVGDVPGSDLTRFDLRSRFSATVAKNYGLGLFGLFTTRHGGRPSRFAYGTSFSTQLGGIGISATIERARTDEGSAKRFFFSLGRSLGRRQNSRSSYDSRTRAAQVELSRSRDLTLSDFGYRASLGQDTKSLVGSGELTYNANRALLSLRHDLTYDRSGRHMQQRSSYSAAVQFAFADGRFAVGRPVGHNFLLAFPHRTLKSDVLVTQGIEDEKIIARSGTLGPALAPGGAPHSPRKVTLRPEELPDGYDPGKSYYELFPGSANGYLAQVGSDANRTVQGNLLSGDGAPLSLAVGSLEWLDKSKRSKTQIFTNRSGRFVATGLAPGRYLLRIGEDDLQAEIVVPDVENGVIEVGRLTVRTAQKS